MAWFDMSFLDMPGQGKRNLNDSSQIRTQYKTGG